MKNRNYSGTTVIQFSNIKKIANKNIRIACYILFFAVFATTIATITFGIIMAVLKAGSKSNYMIFFLVFFGLTFVNVIILSILYRVGYLKPFGKNKDGSYLDGYTSEEIKKHDLNRDAHKTYYNFTQNENSEDESSKSNK